jgi:hypothetical protein
MTTQVHLVGSVALDTAQDVFSAAGKLLGPYLKRIPDGEPGGRRLWISWQIPLLRANPNLQVVAPADQTGIALVPLRLPAYEAAMLREVGRICEAIPHADVAIQWDVCIEMVIWDGRWPLAQPFPGMDQVFGDAFARLAGGVPEDVELGFHLCYGDLDAKHFVQPTDATKMVELANLISSRVPRLIHWMHMPVPIDRSDDAFYAPLRNLQLHPETELFLGLAHVQDGVEGTRRRMAVASKYASNFGIASECGISRGRDPRTAERFLEVYAGAAAAGPAELAGV